MNQEIYISGRLTGIARNAYSGSMDRQSPDQHPKAESDVKSDADALTHEQIIEGMVGGEVRDTRRSIRVDKFEEKFRPEYDQASNASLSDAERAAAAASILGLDSLSETQQKALIKAHYAENPAEKIQYLREGGFDISQRKILIESHLAGMNPPPPNDPALLPAYYRGLIDARVNGLIPGHFQGRLHEIVLRVQELHANSGLDADVLASYGDEIIQLKKDQNINVVEVETLNKILRDIVSYENIASGRERREFGNFLDTYEDLIKERRKALQAGNNAAAAAANDAAAALVLKEVYDLNPQTQNLPNRVIEIIATNRDALEYLVNRIVSTPMDSETGDYQLGFYGGNNLEGILNYLKTQADGGNRSLAVQYQSAIDLRESTRMAHELNKAIINTDQRAFQGLAAQLTDKYLVTLGKVPGVDSVLRLLDPEYQVILARDGWIKGGNHDEINGRVRDPNTGKVLQNQDQSALESFKQEVAIAKAKGIRLGGNQNLSQNLRELADLEDWQIPWAFNVGRAIHNLWLRSAELVAQGEYPKGDQQYLSLPQESIVRIFDYRNKMLERFEISEVRGGVEWVEIAAEIYSSSEAREEDGYGHTEIVRVASKSLQTFEGPAETGVRGFMATWREKQLIFGEVPHAFQWLPDSGQGLLGLHVLRNGKAVGAAGSFADYLDTRSLSFKRNPADPHEKAREWGDLSNAEQGQYIRSLFFDRDWKLLPDINQALGGFIYLMKPSVGEGAHTKAVKEYLRTKLWERAAEENPLALVSVLQGLQLHGDDQPIDLINHATIHIDWRQFSRKLEILNEIRLADIRDRRQVTLTETIFQNRNIQGLRLTHEELNMIRLIRNLGRENPHDAERVAHSLANIRFAFNPFLNDAPLDVNYTVASQEVYRRFINDTGGFDKTNQAKITIMNNPGNYHKAEDVIETLTEMVEGSGAVLGTRDGQRVAWPYVEATGAMFERGGNANNKIEKFFRQMDSVNAVLQFLKKPNSMAQEFAGHEALCLDKKEMYEWSEKLRLAGLLSEEQEKKFRKRFGAIWQIIIGDIIRGVKAALLMSVITTGKEGVSEVPAA